jgi:lysophospholipase L1-like esterase
MRTIPNAIRCTQRAAAVLMLALAGLPHAAFAQAATQNQTQTTQAPPAAPSNVAATAPQAAAPGITERAKEKIDEAAGKVDDALKRAADIFNRVPCSSKGAYLEGSLPGVAKKLVANQPVTIVAFGSSSTVGFGTTSPIFSYPYRLADQLRRKYPKSDITVLNRGIGGEDTPQMLKRIKVAVLDAKPDLVIWQLGTNTVIKGDDADVAHTEALVNEGLDRLKAMGTDVVLIDPQFVPATTSKEAEEKSNKMVNMLTSIAQARQVAHFPRFSVMRSWHTDQKLAFDSFVIHDGLHLNDWGYACFAQLLGDTIIDTVGRIQAGTEVPPDVLLYRPL